MAVAFSAPSSPPIRALPNARAADLGVERSGAARASDEQRATTRNDGEDIFRIRDLSLPPHRQVDVGKTKTEDMPCARAGRQLSDWESTCTLAVMPFNRWDSEA